MQSESPIGTLNHTVRHNYYSIWLQMPSRYFTGLTVWLEVQYTSGNKRTNNSD